jgi:hypothetical protein
VEPLVDAQVSEPESGATRWVRILTISLVVALVCAIGVVWMLGGFADRNDHTWVAPGAEMDAGNLVFTMTSATARRDYSGNWRIEAFGTVRNPHDETLAPLVGETGNLVVSAGSGTEASSAFSVQLGDNHDRALVPPGNQPISLAAVFTIKGEYVLGAQITCGVVVMEYSDGTILGLGAGPYWHSGLSPATYATKVPLTVLKES